MAQPNTTKGVNLVIKAETARDSGVYTTLCTISAERGITFTNQLNEQIIPDCTDLTAIAAVAREKVSYSVACSGGGLVHKQDLVRIETIRLYADAWRMKIILDD